MTGNDSSSSHIADRKSRKPSANNDYEKGILVRLVRMLLNSCEMFPEFVGLYCTHNLRFHFPTLLEHAFRKFCFISSFELSSDRCLTQPFLFLQRRGESQGSLSVQSLQRYLVQNDVDVWFEPLFEMKYKMSGTVYPYFPVCFPLEKS